MEPYLPVARVRMLLAGAVPRLRETLIRRLEASLRAQD